MKRPLLRGAPLCLTILWASIDVSCSFFPAAVAPARLSRTKFSDSRNPWTTRLEAEEATIGTAALSDDVEFQLPDEADEKALFSESTFPISPKSLLLKCKMVIHAQQTGLQDGSLDENIYASDFRFVAPFVGGRTPRPGMNDPPPGLPKKEYLAALRSFDLLAAFPDMKNNYHAFRVDPFEPNRVWFQTRATATHTGSLMGQPPTGRRLELPPQAFSMTFNEAGQVTLFNVGNVIDRTVGNTGGLGGAFGFFYATGQPLPFPECQPFEPSFQMKALTVVQKALKLVGLV